MRVALLSDTHAPRRWHGCPPAVAAHLDGVEVILHAGDICTPDVLAQLAQFAPVHAVRGNNDGPDVDAPETLELDLGGVRVAMIHDSGPASGRGPRLNRLFPAAGLVVFGHSHIPWDGTYAGQRQVNPGSPTDRRRQPHGTIGLADLADGRIVGVRVVPIS